MTSGPIKIIIMQQLQQANYPTEKKNHSFQSDGAISTAIYVTLMLYLA